MALHKITRLTHASIIAAPPEPVYRLVADVTRWPVAFGPILYARYLHRAPTNERFQLWAEVDGEVTSWVSRRVLQVSERRILFRREPGHPSIFGMSGTWSFHPVAGGHTEVVREHSFEVDGDSEVREAAEAAVDRATRRELAALGRIAELGHPVDELIDTFTDVVELDRTPAEVYEFVRRSDLWPSRLPHVGRVELTEDPSGAQRMEMDTVTGDGASHTTHSVRMCFAGERIVYKQLRPPAMLLGHSGEWEFEPHGSRVQVTARHTVAIDPVAARSVLGEHSTLDDAREHLRAALGANSRATLAHAGELPRSTKVSHG